jgi:hypothetical protein
MKRSYTIFTAEGITYDVEGTTLVSALQRAKVPARSVVAVVESESLVSPAPGRLTALVVQPRKSPIGI